MPLEITVKYSTIIGSLYNYILRSNYSGFFSFLYFKVFKKPTTTFIIPYMGIPSWFWFEIWEFLTKDKVYLAIFYIRKFSYSSLLELKAVSRVTQTKAFIFALESFPEDLTLYGFIFEIFPKLSSEGMLETSETESAVCLLSTRHLLSDSSLVAGLLEIKKDSI